MQEIEQTIDQMQKDLNSVRSYQMFFADFSNNVINLLNSESDAKREYYSKIVKNQLLKNPFVTIYE